VASASLVIVDDRSVLAHSGEELFDLLQGGQGVLGIVLGMDKIVSEVDSAITELGRPAAPSQAEARPAVSELPRTSAVGG
jgi:hypothetical protein